MGEERASRRVAHAIVAARAEAPIETTGRLASIIRAVLPPDKSGHHPATRSFQALRLRVNDELGEIERALAQAVRLLNPGGRIIVVSFHSLEDRIVKRFMTEVSGRTPAPSRHDPRGLTPAAPARFRLVTPRALRPAAAEVAANPRARSARLRAIECLEAARYEEAPPLSGPASGHDSVMGRRKIPIAVTAPPTSWPGSTGPRHPLNIVLMPQIRERRAEAMTKEASQ